MAPLNIYIYISLSIYIYPGLGCAGGDLDKGNILIDTMIARGSCFQHTENGTPMVSFKKVSAIKKEGSMDIAETAKEPVLIYLGILFADLVSLLRSIYVFS